MGVFWLILAKIVGEWRCEIAEGIATSLPLGDPRNDTVNEGGR